MGTYSVQVNNGNCFISDTAVISYNTSPAPTAAFTYSIISSSGNNYTLSFTNNTTNGLSYSWDFGDGTTSNLAQPSHVFTCNTLYNIQLIAYNICEADTVTQSFYRNCLTNAVPDITEEISLQIFPIPADEILHLRYQLEKQSEVELKLFNSLGQVVLEKSYGREVGEVHKELGIAPLIEGIYTLRIITESGTAVYKLAVE